MDNQEKKQSIGIRLFKGLFRLIPYFFPFIIALEPLSKLKRMKRIFEFHEKNDKTDKEKISKYYSQAIIKLTIIASISTLPYIFAVVKGSIIFTEDPFLQERMEKVYKKDQNTSFLSAYIKSISVSDGDSKRVIMEKKHSYIRLVAILLLIVISLGSSLIISLALKYLNPLYFGSNKFRKTLIDQHVIKEDNKNHLAFYTPEGFMVDITGHKAKDLILQEAIWTSLDVKIDDKLYLEDPEKRSTVIFIPKYELPEKIIY